MVLMVGDTNVAFCPMSMTDGTARVIELYGSSALKRDILPRLVSRDPSFAFTSGQWMTERPGGSDVSLTETTATPTGRSHEYGSTYHLDGFKWFSSATDSQCAVALARTGTIQQGSRGLSLFLVPMRLPFPGSPPASSSSTTAQTSPTNNIYIHRLKSKVGTHIVPTAELSLSSSQAYLLSPLGAGVKSITPVLNITRLWSATGSVGNLRKCLAIASSYAEIRAIRGGTQLLRNTPIHVEQLARVTVLYRALMCLLFGVVVMMGRVECGVVEAGSEEEKRLRMLTPVVKAFAAEKACTGMEECMSALGGQGYMEENGIGRCIRDGLVEKIWEGTVTVLALDLLRTVQDSSTMKAFTTWATTLIASCPPRISISEELTLLTQAIEEVTTVLSSTKPGNNLLIPRPELHISRGFDRTKIFD